MTLESRLRELLHKGALDLPLPGAGETARRHQCLAAFGREDLTLARMVEAHTDAVAILAEAGRVPVPGALYGVWASEIPSQPLHLDAGLKGSKSFCTGAGLVDRALVTAGESELVDVDLRGHAERFASISALGLRRRFARPTQRTLASTTRRSPSANESTDRAGIWNAPGSGMAPAGRRLVGREELLG